jgi:hypothetical protein
VKLTRLGSRFLSCSTALVFASALPGCSRKGKTPTDEAPVAIADASDPEDASGPARGDEEPAEHAANTSETAAIAEIVPSYPIGLDVLLDLVPEDAESFVIVRDLEGLVAGGFAYAQAQKAAMGRYAAEVAKTDPKEAEDLRRAASVLDGLDGILAASGIDLSAGLVFATRTGSDDAYVVYGSARADALPGVLELLGANDSEIPRNCVLSTSTAGYAACVTGATSTYAPGNRAKQLRARLAATLPGTDVDRGNVVGSITRDGEAIPFVVETGQGTAQIAMAAPAAREPLSKLVQTGPAHGLGIVGPGQGFVWGLARKEAFIDEGSPPPAMLVSFLGSLTGEFVLGNVADMKGFVAAIGVSDPGPASGLVTLASLAFGEVPSELPGGVSLELELTSVEAAGSKVQTIRAGFRGGPVDRFVAMGYTPQVHAFAAGTLAAIAIGTGSEVVSKLASGSTSGPSEALLATLPPALARSLRSNEVAFAAHAPLDAYQATSTRQLLVELLERWGADALEVDAELAAKISLDALAPLSSATVWVTELQRGPVVHVALRGFVEPGTDEGKAALAALRAVSEGADPRTIYATMATEHAASPRASAYRARAGELGDGLDALYVGTAGLGFLGAWLMMADEEPEPPSALEPAHGE